MSELKKQWIDDEHLWQDFVDYFNPDFDEIVDIKQMSHYDILITMKNGVQYIYDNYRQTRRRLPNSWDDMSLKEFHMDAHIRLYSMMQRKGFTYDDLSEETGISVGTISNYVNGVTSPTLDRLFLIAKALGCRIEDLIYIEHMYR